MGRLNHSYVPIPVLRHVPVGNGTLVVCRFEAYFKRMSELDAAAAAPLHVALFTLLNHLSDDSGVHVSTACLPETHHKCTPTAAHRAVTCWS